MRAEVARWLEAGFVRRLYAAGRRAARCVSPAFVTYSSGKPRLVIDYRKVHELLQYKPFCYELLPEFIASLCKDDHLISCDIKDAFHHLYVSKADRPYLAFTIDGETYEAMTMPFGLSVAPWAWTKAMRPVLAHLRSLGSKPIGYVDDHGACPPGPRPTSRADAVAGFKAVAELYHKLGLVLHPDKGERDGKQQLDLLGFRLDTRANRLTVTAKRLAKVTGMAKAVLSAASGNRRYVRYKALQRMAGLAVSTQLAIPEARLYTRSIYDDLAGSLDDRYDRQLSHQSVRDLRFWASLTADQDYGRLLWAPAPTVTLHTDASGAGWGGGLARGTQRWSARGTFTAKDATLHINTKEVLAVRLSFLSVERHLLPGETVHLFTDSRVALHTIQGLTSRSAPLLAELRRLHGVLRRLRINLVAEWLPTADNVWADGLSRTTDRADWTLEKRFFTASDNMYGPHEVDRFATLNNAQLPRYNSAALDPGTEAVDALEQDWTAVNNWVNPPINLIPLVMRHLAAQRASATVVVPVWPAQAWWQPALMQADQVCYLPRSAGINLPGAATDKGRQPHWRVCALRVTRGGRRPQASLGPGPPAPSAARPLATAPAVVLPRTC